MLYEIECSRCGHLSKSLLNFKCPECSQPLSIKLMFDFEIEKIESNNYSLWRYLKFFPYAREENIVTLGEGWTPLVKFSENVYFKCEYLNPTGSFKDRGSTMLISALCEKIDKIRGYISEDSSGNAGASVAAYAARAKLKARIYVPEDISGPKFNQIRFYGAEVFKVFGSRKRVAEEAQRREHGKVYVGHILHPLFRDGIRSLAYEIAEQLHWKAPEYVYLPVSAGTLLLGVIAGFKHLAKSKVIRKIPKIVACQTRQVSPLYHSFKDLSYRSPDKITSIADALVSINPPLLNLMVESLKKVKGDTIIVDENEISAAFIELSQNGFFVEPSSAVAYAAYKKQVKKREILEEGVSVIILTGTGLKTMIQLQ